MDVEPDRRSLAAIAAAVRRWRVLCPASNLVVVSTCRLPRRGNALPICECCLSMNWTLITWFYMKTSSLTRNNWRPCSPSGAAFTCEECGRTYKHYVSLLKHKKVHLGLTRCLLCDAVSNTVQDLRKHLRAVHHLSTEDVLAIVPRTRQYYGKPAKSTANNM